MIIRIVFNGTYEQTVAYQAASLSFHPGFVQIEDAHGRSTYYAAADIKKIETE
jgi:hypothetical protein